MNSQVTSHVTRRGLLSAAGSASLLALFRPAEVLATDVDDKSPSCKVEASRDWKDVDKDLRRLLPLWQEERKQFVLSSNTADSWQGPHGKAIVALGPAILPALIHELRPRRFLLQCSAGAHHPDRHRQRQRSLRAGQGRVMVGVVGELTPSDR